MSETILHVNIPADVAVGTCINVQYEGRYYEVIVPEGAPGNQIQVTVPYIEPSSSASEGGGSSSAVEENAKKEKETDASGAPVKPNNEAIMMGGAAAVVGIGALCVAPVLILTGVAVGGVALAAKMVHTKKTTGESEGDQIDKAIVGMNNLAIKTAGKLKSFDDEHKITEKTKDGIAKVNAKITEVDDKYKISDKANAALAAATVKANELDKQYDISGKATAAAQSAAATFNSVFASVTGKNSNSNSNANVTSNK